MSAVQAAIAVVPPPQLVKVGLTMSCLYEAGGVSTVQNSHRVGTQFKIHLQIQNYQSVGTQFKIQHSQIQNYQSAGTQFKIQHSQIQNYLHRVCNFFAVILCYKNKDYEQAL